MMEISSCFRFWINSNFCVSVDLPKPARRFWSLPGKKDDVIRPMGYGIPGIDILR